MLVPLIVGAALWLSHKDEQPAPVPAAPSTAPAVPDNVVHYLTNASVIMANDKISQGMTVDEASRQAASDVVDNYIAQS